MKTSMDPDSIDNVILESYVPREAPNGGAFGDYVSFWKERKVIEDNINTTAEVTGDAQPLEMWKKLSKTYSL